jgi:hypothetical protein
MILKNKHGREIECSFFGSRDDVQCDLAVYLDDFTDVDDDTVEWLMTQYAADIDEELTQNAVMRAESYYEGDR